jgi:hypothetical protein
MANDENDDLKNVQHLLGKRGETVKQVPLSKPSPTSAYQPPKAKMPERPKAAGTPNPAAQPRRGTPTPFAIIDPRHAPVFKEEPPLPFAGDKAGKFDPELNEFALQEIAKERGITVEELLKTEGKKLERKVEPLNPTEQAMSAADAKKLLEAAHKEQQRPPSSFETPEAYAAPANETAPDAAYQLELEELELQRKQLELKRRRLQSGAPVMPTEAQIQHAQRPAPQDERKLKPLDNPVIRKMRERLSMERIKPETVEIEDIKFSLLPPPSSTYSWALEKLTSVQQDGEDAIKLMLKSCTAALGIVLIEGQPVAEVLGLVPEGTVKTPLNPPLELRILTAQTLLEMMAGDPSIEGLFPFNPDMAQKLYLAFEAAFKNIELKSSLDPKLRHFTCPVPDCQETADRPVAKGANVFCPVHGVPMDDRGLSTEAKALPLQ